MLCSQKTSTKEILCLLNIYHGNSMVCIWKTILLDTLIIPSMYVSIYHCSRIITSTFHVCWVFFGVLVSLSSEMGSSEMWACDTHRIIVHASAFQLNLLSNYLDNIFEHHRCVDFFTFYSMYILCMHEILEWQTLQYTTRECMHGILYPTMLCA